MSEILRELAQARGEHPITEKELEDARGGILGTWPLDFEKPSYLLDETRSIWRYQLPHDWITGFPDRIRAVELDAANQSWQKHIDTRKLVILVVGDIAEIKPGIDELGYPVRTLDTEGNPLDG